MLEEEKLPIPLEFRKKLAATDQKRHAGDYYDSTISMFYYEPKSPTLEKDYPAAHTIYFKASDAFCPDQIAITKMAKDYLIGFPPVWHSLLGFKVKTKPKTKDFIRPYFHFLLQLVEKCLRQVCNAEGSANMKETTLNMPIGNWKVKCVKIPHFAWLRPLAPIQS